MQPSERYRIECAELVLPSAQLNHDLEFFCGLGFTIDLIYPADSPELYVLQGHGLRIRLESGLEQSDARLRLTIPAGEGAPQNCVAPNGTRVEFVAIDATEALAPLCSTLSICRDSDQAWGTGRAGMQYRDLIPDRAGGHFIASHIRILEGGLVPDYVHYHRVDVQIIYCLKGWVKVVYEDQGEPFVLCEGDCISQPPLIRHRVLECSPGLEVLEIGSPARHETRSDPALNLPNQSFRPQREFDGQVFLRHEALGSTPCTWHFDGFEARETGLETATKGLARLQVATRVGALTQAPIEQLDAFRFWFIAEGSLRLRVNGNSHDLESGDSIVLPQGATIEVLGSPPGSQVVEFAQGSPGA